MRTFLIASAALGFFIFFSAVFVALAADWQRNKQPPPQPIAFSHEIHVGRVGLKCEDCHQYADKAAFAGIPSVQKCMQCHANVLTDRPEIQKLAGYWERQEPVPWNRVHRIRIRKHVYFSHKPHIRAGVQCEQCHGDVRYAGYPLRRARSLEMGWCVSCHEKNNASTDCLICHQ